MKYSLSNWIFGTEDLEITLMRLKKYNYDAIELEGKPEEKKYDLSKVKALLSKYSLNISSIAGMFPWRGKVKRDLATEDKVIRDNTINYIIDSIDYAWKIKAELLIIVPTAIYKTIPSLSKKEDWENSVRAVRVVAKYAEKKDILLAIEPINRYETYMVNTIHDALLFSQNVGSSHVKVMGDTFHMNIEEQNIIEAIKEAGSNLINLHIADSNRGAVGRGHINFRSIFRALKDINYKHTLTLEYLPIIKNKDILDVYAKESIINLRHWENQI